MQKLELDSKIKTTRKNKAPILSKIRLFLKNPKVQKC